MSSRDKILAAVKNNQPEHTPLPDLSFLKEKKVAAKEQFAAVVQAIGATVFIVKNIEEVKEILQEKFQQLPRKITSIPALADVADTRWVNADPHSLDNVDLAILEARLGVCENGAVWLTEKEMIQRVTPFIADSLAVVLSESKLVANMHTAYEIISDAQYGFAGFIAGPSKTADIEQSLVLGAHGPRNMFIFLTEE
jgi:L-lactate dehydrogenase complex protein LldG